MFTVTSDKGSDTTKPTTYLLLTIAQGGTSRGMYHTLPVGVSEAKQFIRVAQAAIYFRDGEESIALLADLISQERDSLVHLSEAY